MNVHDAIQNRRSIRKYKSKDVSDDDIKKILEAARVAPSGNNAQPWNFIVVKDPKTKEKLSEISHRQKWMMQAPVFIVAVADVRTKIKDQPDLSIDEDSPQVEVKKIIRDTTIATEHIVLQAQELGLGTCWIAWFIQKDVRPILNIPPDKYVLAIITIGYADEDPKSRKRKSLEEILRYEKW